MSDGTAIPALAFLAGMIYAGFALSTLASGGANIGIPINILDNEAV